MELGDKVGITMAQWRVINTLTSQNGKAKKLLPYHLPSQIKKTVLELGGSDLFNCTLILIDFQPQMAFAVKSIDGQSLINNAAG